MQSFIVLGIIPGTDIQTGLDFWIVIAALFVLLAFRSVLVAAWEYLQTLWAIRKIAATINSCDFVNPAL